LSLLRKISQGYGTTLVVVTHDTEIAQQAEQRLHLSNGEISDETN
jgi:ABC-type lipoprotein export system ATPase subunit